MSQNGPRQLQLARASEPLGPLLGFFYQREVLMKKFPKPWFRPSRNTWYVTLNGSQINLGSDKDVAFARYRELLAKPQPVRATSDLMAAVCDAFLEWTQKHRSADTYELLLAGPAIACRMLVSACTFFSS